MDINNNTLSDGQDDVLPRNPFLVLAEDTVPEISQADRSAVLVHSALRFVSALRHGVLPPDINSKSGNPLSMRLYMNLFGTTRCPSVLPGEIENFDLNKPYASSDLDEGWKFTSSEANDSEDESDDELPTPPLMAESAGSDQEHEVFAASRYRVEESSRLQTYSCNLQGPILYY